MQYLSLGIGIILSISSFSALADDSNQSGLGAAFGVGAGGGFSIKKTLGDTNQLLAGFNLSQGQYQNQSTFNGTTTNTNSIGNAYSMQVGIRHFLTKEKLSNFVQLSIVGSYVTNSSSGISTSYKSFSILPGYGVEYFIAPNFSIEGTVGLGLHYSSGDYSDNNSTSKNIQLPFVGTAITYYW